MLRTSPVQPPRPFWQELALAVVAAAVTPLAHHAGKAIREHLAARREPQKDRSDDPDRDR